MTHGEDRTTVAGGSTVDHGGTAMKVFKSGREAVRLQGYRGHGAVSLSYSFVYGALRQHKAYGDSSLQLYSGTGCIGFRDHRDRWWSNWHDTLTHGAGRRSIHLNRGAVGLLRLSDEKDEIDSFDQEHTLSVTRALNESTNLFVQISQGEYSRVDSSPFELPSLSSSIRGMLAKGSSMPKECQVALAVCGAT
ncbi:unnamed protein product [Prunus armeniaca]